MVLVETNFPRGGTIQKRESAEVNFGAKQVKTKKKNHSIKDQKVENEVKIEAISAELLTYKSIQEGMLLYGMIKHVDPISLKVSLPGRLVGKVYASSISDSYNKIIKKFIQASEKLENFKPLDQMYSVGQSVYAKVMEVKENDDKTRAEVSLSFKPSDLHLDLYHENINKGMIFVGAIEEIQDHGYVIESGIKNLRCFLPKENIDEVEDDNFGVGQLLFVKIVKLTQFKNASTAVCKFLNKESKRRVKDLIDPRLEYLMPSSIVNFTISKILKDGLQGTIMNGNFTAYVNEHQFKEIFAKPDDYEVNSTIAAKILYIMPLSKLVYLSLKNKDRNIQEQDLLKRGKILDASVHHHGTGGIILKLDEDKKAVLSFNSLKSHITGNFDQDNLLSKYNKNSVHKIRIIDYDFVDDFYICTDNPKILNEKYFTLEDCNVGEFVTVNLKDRDKISGTLYIKLGYCNAIMEKIFQSSQLSLTAVENTKLKCRILGVNSEKNIVYLTNRQEYMKQDAKILKNVKKVNMGNTFMGTIVKCTETFFVVKFFNGIKGILYKSSIASYMSSQIDSFSVGYTMLFRILKKVDEKLLLNLANEIFETGEISIATVDHYLESGLEISVNNESEKNIKGLIPVQLLTEFPDLNPLKLKTYIPGQPIEVVCAFQNIFSIRDIEYFKENPVKNFSSLQEGDILRGSIKNISDEIVEVLLPVHNYNKLLRIHLKMILPNLSAKPNVLVDPDQLIYVKILSKEYQTKALTVSAKLTDVWDGDFKFTGKLFAKYLDEIQNFKKYLKSKNDQFGQLKIGDIATTVMSHEVKETSDCYIEFENGIQGIIKSHLFCKTYKESNEIKEYKKGDKIDVIILWIDYVNKLVYCSNQNPTMKKIANTFQLPQNLLNKSGITGKVLLVFNNFVIASLKRGQNPLVFVPTRLHYNDFESSVTTKVIEGDFCKLCFVHDKYSIAIFEETMKLWNNFKFHKRKRIELEEESIKKKRKIYSESAKILKDSQNESVNKEKSEEVINTDVQNCINISTAFIEKNSSKHVDVKCQNELRKLEIDSDDAIEALNFEDDLDNFSDEEISKVKKIKKIPDEKNQSKLANQLLPGANDFWSTNIENLTDNRTTLESSSEEDENEEEIKHKKKGKRLTAADRFKAEKVEEAHIREIENKYADLYSEPESADQFDRLVLSDPNNSKNWIKYMVYHLQTTELDKARVVAKRALKTISFREQEELINVWIALLNLELNYGSKENLNTTLKEALLCNDPLKIYLRVIEILTNSKKIQELTEVISTVTKKFKDNPDVWKTAASAMFQVGLREKGQQLLHRALSALPEREHVNTIVAFASINHKNGDRETAHTLMEQILTSYPKRIDVWSQYVDMLLKDSLVEAARRTLERAVVQKIPLKKMRTLFKKYLEFEEKYGDETNVLKVKELAQNYVKNEV